MRTSRRFIESTRQKALRCWGFHATSFGHQEPGSEAEIKSFCSLNYDVTFPLFAKVKVNGPASTPLYRYLKSACRGLLFTKSIKWNFTKFLIDRQGIAVRRYAPTVSIARIDADLPKLLADRTHVA